MCFNSVRPLWLHLVLHTAQGTMNLLYDLSVELQGIILAEALKMRMHRTQAYKLLDDREHYALYWMGSGWAIIYMDHPTISTTLGIILSTNRA